MNELSTCVFLPGLCRALLPMVYFRKTILILKLFLRLLPCSYRIWCTPHFWVLWPSANYRTSRLLHFPFHKMGILSLWPPYLSGQAVIKWQPLLLWRVCDAGETAWDLPAGPSSTTELDKRCDFEQVTQLLRASVSLCVTQGAVLLWELDEMICTEGLTQARRLGSAPHKEAIDVFGFLPGIVSCRELVLMIWNSRNTWCID